MLKLEKATLYTLGMFGAQKREVKDLEVVIKPYAQYPSAVHFSYVEKGKRKRVGFVHGSSPSLVVFEGWGHALEPADPLEAVPGGQRSRYGSFDPRYAEEFGQALARYVETSGKAPTADYRAFDTFYQARETDARDLEYDRLEERGLDRWRGLDD